MRKEVLLAILAGGVFGLIIAFGIWRLNSNLTSTTTTQGTPPPTTVDSSGVTIAKPSGGQVVTDPTVEISGITKPSSYVVISTSEEDFYSQTNPSGEFSLEVDLVGGYNLLNIFVFDNSGIIAETNLDIVYSSEFKNYLKEDTKEDEVATNSADEIREKVQEKVKEIQNNSVFFLGTVTDISEGTLQIKLESGEIEQVSTTKDTSFASETKKTIEEEDVAIGDFIIAMGFTNGSDVLEAKRVVVITKSEEVELQTFIGTVESTSSRQLTLVMDGEEVEVSFGKTWKGPNLSELDDNQLIIVVGEKSKEFTARSLFEIGIETSPSPSSSEEE